MIELHNLKLIVVKFITNSLRGLTTNYTSFTWIFLWVKNLTLLLKNSKQVQQKYFLGQFFTSCTSSFSSDTKLALQFLHLKVRFRRQFLDFKCLSRLNLLGKFLSQYSQLSFPADSCESDMCLARFLLNLIIFWHTSHLMLSGISLCFLEAWGKWTFIFFSSPRYPCTSLETLLLFPSLLKSASPPGLISTLATDCPPHRDWVKVWSSNLSDSNKGFLKCKDHKRLLYALFVLEKVLW